MPRQPRSHQMDDNQTYHILNRGILRQEIFHDDQDASYFLQTINRYKQKASFEVYHWCLMPNHFHLLIELSNGYLLSKVVGACQQIYAFYYHRRYKTAGRLFQNRFKSQAIQKERYLFACGRYIELNPVRAGLVELPWQWRWTSARYYAFEEKDDITSFNPSWKDRFQNVENYKQWILNAEDAKRESELFKASTNIAGDDDFRKQQFMQNGHAVPKHLGRPKRRNNVIRTA